MSADRSGRVDLAVSPRARLRGLIGRHAPGEGPTLILAPCRSIHTIGMRFPIDVAFVSRGGRIVRSERAVTGGRFLRHKGAHLVVERYARPNDPWPAVGDRMTLRIDWME